MFFKKTILTVVILIVAIGAVSLGIKRYEKQDRFLLKNIAYRDVSYIEVMNRGLPGRQVLFFRNRDSIAQIGEQLKTAPPIAVINDSWKDSKGMCEIVLHFNNHNATALTYANLPYDGGIISSGAYNYHNNTLLRLFMDKFKADR